MKKILCIMVVLSFIVVTPLGAGMSKKGKKCHNDCASQKKEAVQQCLEVKAKPLSLCLKKASEAKKECLKQCTKKE